MRKLILSAHISLDGFAGGPGGSLEWFDASEENLQFVCKLAEQADGALFGRVSYHLLNDYWPHAKDRSNATPGEIAFSNWYNKAQKIIVSKTMAGENLHNTIVIADNISAEISSIKEQPGKDILIFGAPSVSQLLMQFNLVDEYWIFVNPVIFGQGIPMFAALPNQIKLKVAGIKQFSNGEIGIHYILNPDKN
jgi:dihydrofolate reductase